MESRESQDDQAPEPVKCRRTPRSAVASGYSGLLALMPVFGVIVTALGLLLLTQATLIFRARQGSLRGVLKALIGAGLCFVGGMYLWSLLPSSRANYVLGRGRLASLPKSAENVREYSWSGIFTGEWYVVFEASDEDIEKLIRESESIHGDPPKLIGPEHEKAEDVLRPNHLGPEWFRWHGIRKGRVYTIPPVDMHYWGTVAVDDETNTVFVVVVWS